MLRPDQNPAPEPEVPARRLATFVRGSSSSEMRNSNNSAVERRVHPPESTGRPTIRPTTTTSGFAVRPEVVCECRPGRPRAGSGCDRMRLIVEENGDCRVGRGVPHHVGSPSRTPTVGGRPRSSDAWEPARLTGGGALSPVGGGVRSPRSSSGSLPRLGRPLYPAGAAVCTAPWLPADVPPPPRSPGVAGTVGWWRGASSVERHPRVGSDDSHCSHNSSSTASQRPASRDDDGEIDFTAWVTLSFAETKVSGLSGRVVGASDCGVRGPRFESRRGQLCLSRRLLRYTVLGTGCAPLL